MGKYSSYERKMPPRIREPHPIWRGFGCLMLLIVPVFSFAVSMLLVQIGRDNDWPIPVELLGRPQLPDILFRIPGLVPFWQFIENQRDLYAHLVLTLIISMVLMGILSLVYAFVYRYVGPPQYGPLDAPPPNVRTKRYKR